MFWLFALLRSGIGVGDAAFASVSSSIISDLYAGEKRTKMLSIFFLAIPLGSGKNEFLGAWNFLKILDKSVLFKVWVMFWAQVSLKYLGIGIGRCVSRQW
jgi:MFS family permease